MSVDFVVVSLRPAAFGATGDSGRAASIAAALSAGGYSVRAESALRDGEGILRALANPRALGRLFTRIREDGRTQPAQCLVAQAIFDARGVGTFATTTVFVTSRVAPTRRPPGFCMDFVDSLALNASSRAGSSRLLRRFWLREARLLASWEQMLAAEARVATAVSKTEAELIASSVRAVALERPGGTFQFPAPIAEGSRPPVIFAGNLFYYPNHEAAHWIADLLAPALIERGWRPSDIVVAGRRPSKALRARAKTAGVSLVADPPDLATVIADASIALAPVVRGSGVQTKVVNGLALGKRMVISREANRGLNLADSWMVRIAERSPEAFAEAIGAIVEAPQEDNLPSDVRALMEQTAPEAVRRRWVELLAGGVRTP